MAEEGSHGTGSRFMPLLQNMPDDMSSRMVPVAGVYPGITAEELKAPLSSPAAPIGMWQFDFSDPEGPQLGTVVLPPSSAVQMSEDPVVIVAQSADLALSLRNNVEAEVLVVIDRAARTFENDRFYAFAAPDGATTIRWFEEIPAGYSIIGKVVIVVVPYLENMKIKSSGFMEDQDDFCFG